MAKLEKFTNEIFGMIKICSDCRDAFVQGYDCPMLVLFTTDLQGSHNDNIISRCKSRTVIVSSKKAVEEIILPEVHSNDWAVKVIITGTRLPATGRLNEVSNKL